MYPGIFFLYILLCFIVLLICLFVHKINLICYFLKWRFETNGPISLAGDVTVCV